MRIAVSAAEPRLDRPVDPRFGRCRYFVLVDSETMEWKALDNENAGAAGGAGIRAAQAIADEAVDVVVTGNCGPNAYQTLAASGIQVVTGASGSIEEAVEAYKQGGLQPTPRASVAAHYGTGASPGMGMGRGMGKGRWAGPSAPPSSDALAGLTEQLRALTREIEGLSDRLDALERKRE